MIRTGRGVALNQVYCEDNLPFMESLLDESIDLIYLDPPFMTGRSFGKFNDKWPSKESFFEYMDERLFHCHRLLRDTGSLYLHCDHRTNYRFRYMLNEIFGEDNFMNEIVWERSPSGIGNSTKSKMFPRNIDTILFYKKSRKSIYKNQYLPLSESNRKRYSRKEPETGRIFKTVSLGDYSEKSIKDMEEKNLIYTSKTGNNSKKYYLDECKGRVVGSVWSDIKGFSTGSGGKQRTGYPTQKPIALLERIIKASSNQGDLVADFFCGSGTTLVAAKKLGRYYLGCDLSEDAVKITKERMDGTKEEA